MFFDGLSEFDYPYNFIVEKGINDLIIKGSYKVLPVVPQLIIPIKSKFLVWLELCMYNRGICYHSELITFLLIVELTNFL